MKRQTADSARDRHLAYLTLSLLLAGLLTIARIALAQDEHPSIPSLLSGAVGSIEPAHVRIMPATGAHR